MTLDHATTFARLPPERILPAARATAKLVVLDDDPTGTQTVHGIPVLTSWNVADLAAELLDPSPAVFLLTNTRAFEPERAVALIQETAAALRAASIATGRDFVVVSRSDSTLRGHYPAETDALAAAVGGVEATFIIPAFFAGGRYTIGDVHYVADNGRLLPASETEFARDASFGYRNSNLRFWVEEKTAGNIAAGDVVSVSVEDLRIGGATAVANCLLGTPAGSTVVVNAAARSDLAVFTHALADPRLRGRRYLFRTAADFISTYADILPRPILAPAELRDAASPHGGLLVAGSFVGRTTAQLEVLFSSVAGLARVELSVPALLDPSARGSELARAGHSIENNLSNGRSVVVSTSRAPITGGDPAATLALGAQVSSALVALVRSLTVRPSWLVAKGGITSSDLATAALGIRRALVMGQALPGVPVWCAGTESKWPGLAYVVFPGNVGGSDALARLVAPLIVRSNPSL